MRTKVFLGLILASVGLTTAAIILFKPVQPLSPVSQQVEAALTYKPADTTSPPQASEPPHESGIPKSPLVQRRTFAEQPTSSTEKLERLAQTREMFRALAASDAVSAIRSARQITNENEKEIALVTLVTEWTHGELSSPRERARAIAAYGLDAGLGTELAKNPQLASLWASELTEPASRLVVLQRAASNMLNSDPSAAFAVADQIRLEDRPKFLAGLYADWAQNDTDAALRWAEKLPDLAQQADALNAIRSVAPVGIGAALATQEGYPVILNVLPGTPAEVSGQLHKGDRIVGLSQGDNSFVDARNVSLADIVQMVRGAAGSVLQLQIVPANSPPNALPRTVSLVREQVKFKK